MAHSPELVVERDNQIGGREGSSGVVAVAALPGAAAIYEVRAEARRATVIASGNTGTLQRELESAGARGQCIVDGDGLEIARRVRLHPCVVRHPSR